MMGWYQQGEEALLLRIHVQARARADGIVGLHNGRLKVRIKAPALEGKANRHLQELLAREFATSKTRVRIVKGLSNPDKRVEIKRPLTLPDWFHRLIVDDS